MARLGRLGSFFLRFRESPSSFAFLPLFNGARIGERGACCWLSCCERRCCWFRMAWCWGFAPSSWACIANWLFATGVAFICFCSSYMWFICILLMLTARSIHSYMRDNLVKLSYVQVLACGTYNVHIDRINAFWNENIAKIVKYKIIQNSLPHRRTKNLSIISVNNLSACAFPDRPPLFGFMLSSPNFQNIASPRNHSRLFDHPTHYPALVSRPRKAISLSE